MKKFLIRVTCFCYIIVVIFLLLVCIFPVPQSYLTEYSHKVTLLKSVQSPRLVFVGGSNLAFGLNSKAIQDSTGIKVINTGLHAGIGLKSMLDTTEPYLRTGDYVIIAPEYSQFFGSFNGSETLAMLAFTEGWPIIKCLNFNQLSNVIEFMPKLIIDNTKTYFRSKDISSTNLYSHDGFNEFGDFTKHWNRPRENIKITELNKEFDSNAADYLAEKIDSWREQGIIVYTYPPVVVRSYYLKNENRINILNKELGKRGISFIVNPERHVLPDSMAFDTPYHMSIYGVKENTAKIIENLRPILP